MVAMADRKSKILLALGCAAIVLGILIIIASFAAQAIASEGGVEVEVKPSSTSATGFSFIQVAERDGTPIEGALAWDEVRAIAGHDAGPTATLQEYGSMIAGGDARAQETARDALSGPKAVRVSPGEAAHVEPGWYVVAQDGGDPFLELIEQDRRFWPKAQAPTLEKEVQAADGSWSHEAVWGAGCEIPYRLKATMPEGIGEYGEYRVAFADEWDGHLTIDEGSIRVLLSAKGRDAADITAGSAISAAQGSLRVETPDMLALGAGPGDELTLLYTMHMSPTAQAGTEGMPNTAHLEYPRDPLAEETSRTVEDRCVVRTLALAVRKVDGQGAVLPGAAFALKAADGRFVAADGRRVSDPEEAIRETAEDGIAIFGALGQGGYELVEMRAPEGFAKPNPDSAKVELSLERGDEGRFAMSATAEGIGEVESLDAKSGTCTVKVVNERRPTGSSDVTDVVTRIVAATPAGAPPAAGAQAAGKTPLTGDSLAAIAAAALLVLGSVAVWAVALSRRPKKASEGRHAREKRGPAR